MRRRDVITLIGGTAALTSVTSLQLRAQQQPAKLPLLGILLYSTPKGDPNLASFLRAFRELGYVEGQNIAIEYRYAEGRPERLADLAAELVRLKPDLLFCLGGDVTVPASFLLDDLASKRLEFLKEAAPRVSRIAFVWNPDHPDNEPDEAERAATKLGVQLQRLPVRDPHEFEGTFRAASEARADALYVVSSRQTVREIPKFVSFAAGNRIPLAGGWGAWAQAGGLLSYGPNLNEMMRYAASYAEKILKGANPAELPIQQPTRFELVINLNTARALGVEVPPTLLARADEVIE